MAGFAIRGKVDGLQPLLLRMDGMKRAVRNKILRKAVRRGAALMNKAAKAAVKPVSHSLNRKGIENLNAADIQLLDRVGILRESLGIKVAVTKRGAVVAVIGPRRGFKTQIGVRIRDGKYSKAGDPVYEDPANIAHLVEFGHAGPHPAPPHPFMRPAFDGTKAAARRDMADTIAAGIAQAAKGGG